MTTPLRPAQAIQLVARRELVTQVRSRSFVIGLGITLALFAAFGLLGTLIAQQKSSSSLAIGAESAPLRDALEASAATQDVDLRIIELPDDVGRAQVAAGDIDAVLTGGPGGYHLLGRETVDARMETLVTTAVHQQMLTTALTAAGVDPAQLAARETVGITTLEPADPNRGQQLALALIGTILLFISFSGYGQLVATGVVEEKQSRVVELLLATIKPWHLLAGKIIGLGLVGLLQLVILGAIGVVAAAATGMLTLPSAAFGMFAMVIGWYLLGFFLFAALYAAVGSTVSRQEELNSVVAPMIVVIIIPFVLAVNLLPGDPHNEIAAVLSFVPFFAQTVMPARYALGAAPLWQVGVAALLTVGAIAVVVRVAGRVYQNSILRTGARVSLREALRARS
jgi:ABC-2 type transport system permease protein